MIQVENREIRISVAVQEQPNGTYLLSSDIAVAPEEAKSIEGVLKIIGAWAEIRLSQDDARDSKIVVDLSYPPLARKTRRPASRSR